MIKSLEDVKIGDYVRVVYADSPMLRGGLFGMWGQVTEIVRDGANDGLLVRLWPGADRVPPAPTFIPIGPGSEYSVEPA